MKALLAPLADRRSYQTLLFLLLALPPGAVGCVLIVAGWIGTAILLVTLLGGPVLAGFRVGIGAVAAAEAALARGLLELDVRPAIDSGGRGLYARVGAILFDASSGGTGLSTRAVRARRRDADRGRGALWRCARDDRAADPLPVVGDEFRFVAHQPGVPCVAGRARRARPADRDRPSARAPSGGSSRRGACLA
jgi:Putative sensor